MATKGVLTNIRIIAPSRARPKAGDLFAIRPDELGYLFGRVIDPDTPRFGFPKPVILTYLYAPLFPTMEVPPRAALRPDALLIPPFGINRLPWSRGYFHVVDHWPLTDTDVLPRHIFMSTLFGKHVFLDEDGHPVTDPGYPVGPWALRSYRTVDDDISEALGIPQVPDDD
jgi:Immunity protein 26